jgi:transketolase
VSVRPEPVQTYEQALLALAREHQEIVVMTAENRAHLRQLPRELGPRFVDVGICEQTLIGASAGLALRGRIPVVHALATFLTLRAFEFIRTDVGIAHLPVKLVGFVPGFLSEANGPTHQAIDDIAVMRAIPGMQVFCPADLEELVLALPAIVASPAPAYVRYTAAPPAVRHIEPFAIGKAEWLAAEEGVSILTYGPLLREAERARAILAARGVPVGLVNLRCLEPVDEEAIVVAARGAELVVTLEDHFHRGGLHTIVAETCLAHRIAPRVLGIDLGQTFFKPALHADVLSHEGFTGAQLAERILDALCDREAHA